MATSSSMQSPRSTRSFRRPGVATTTSAPATQRGRLLADRQPADHGRDPQPHGAGVRGQRVVDLPGEFPGGDEDEGERLAGLGTAADGAGEERQAEGEGLAGAGAATAEHVTAGQGVRQRGRLDGERRGDALAAEGGEHLAGEAEVLEGLHRGERGGDRLGEGELPRRHGPAARAALALALPGRTAAAAGAAEAAAAALGGALVGGAGTAGSIVRTCLCHGEPSLMWRVSRNVRRSGTRGIARTSLGEWGRGGGSAR